jgi:hypothetical protein
MKRLLDHPRLGQMARLLLGGVFLWASLDKIAHPAEFAKIVYDYQLLSVTASNVLAITLPWVELVAGLGLLSGVFRDEALLVVNALLLLFIGALSLTLLRGIDVACGCFAVEGGGRTTGWSTLVQDLALLALGLAAWRQARYRTSIGPPLPAQSEGS